MLENGILNNPKKQYEYLYLANYKYFENKNGHIFDYVASIEGNSPNSP
jgi:hypothetical protein